MATYYIDPTGVDDAGRNGLTTGTAWATLSYACTRVTTAGDRIYINSGNYVDNTQAVLSLGVNVTGNPANRPVITTSFNPGGNLDLSQPYLKPNSAGDVSVDGNHEISYVNFNGSNLACRSAIVSYYRNNVKIHHCNFEDFKNHAIGLIGTNTALSVTPPMAIPPNYATGNEIHNCVITNCTQYDAPSSAGAISFRGQDGLKIYNCKLDHGDRAIGLSGDEIVGYNNKNVKIHDNTFYRNDIEGNWNFYAEIHNSNGGMELYNNDFIGRATVDLSGGVKGVSNYSWKAYNNTFNTKAGTIVANDTYYTPFIDIEAFDVAEDYYIYNNSFKNSAIPIYINNCQTSASRIYVYYNLIEEIGNTTNNGSWGILVSSSWDDNPVPFTDIKIWNNVIVSNTTNEAVGGISFSVRGDITGLEIRNNIIIGNTKLKYPIVFNGFSVGCEVINSFINKNIIFGSIENSIHYDHGTNPVTFTNCDLTDDDIAVDPLFVGGFPYSYALQPNSPAINAGLDVGLVSDFIGTLVPYGSAPDIGAYEWFEVEYDFSNITLVNTPACYNAVDNSIISRWVATECPINFTLLRRDWYITNSADVGGFLAISVYGSFTGNDNDVISVYDLTTNSMYTGTITDSSGDPVLITDIPYVAGMDIKYLNDHTLYAGYYFEGRLTINGVVESLTVIASPDSFGYADLDVSGILRIKTSIGKVTNYLSLIQKDTNKSGQFTLEYRGCWYGSNEAYITEGSQTSPASEVVWYYAECVRSEEQGCNLAEYVPTDLNDAPFLNQFDTPVYWYGLPFDLSFILPERAELSPTSDIIVTMKVYNSANVQMGTDIVQTIDVDSLEGYVNSLNINSTLIDAGAAYFTVEIFSM